MTMAVDWDVKHQTKQTNKLHGSKWQKTGPEILQFFSCSTIVGILTFINRINTISECLEQEILLFVIILIFMCRVNFMLS